MFYRLSLESRHMTKHIGELKYDTVEKAVIHAKKLAKQYFGDDYMFICRDVKDIDDEIILSSGALDATVITTVMVLRIHDDYD